MGFWGWFSVSFLAFDFLSTQTDNLLSVFSISCPEFLLATEIIILLTFFCVFLANSAGIEVKPGKPYPYHSDNIPGRLHVTQVCSKSGIYADVNLNVVRFTI